MVARAQSGWLSASPYLIGSFSIAGGIRTALQSNTNAERFDRPKVAIEMQCRHTNKIKTKKKPVNNICSNQTQQQKQPTTTTQQNTILN